MDAVFGLLKNLNGREKQIADIADVEQSLSPGFGLQVVSSFRSSGVGAPCLECDFCQNGKTRGLVNGFAPRIFLRPSPAQAIPLEMLKTFGARAGQSRGRRGQGQEAGGPSSVPVPQRVTFNQFMFISCSIHALIHSNYCM